MTIVQSFWHGKQTIEDVLEFSAGWKDPKYHFASWLLSSLLLSKNYKTTVLVTDSLGREVLIDMLRIPYSHCIVMFDDLPSDYNKLWVLPKIKAYTMIDKPFMHVDGDVFLWKRIQQEMFDKGDLWVQNFEIGFRMYHYAKKYMSDNQAVMNDLVSSRFDLDISINAGVIGGNDPAFFRDLLNICTDTVNHNRDILNNNAPFINQFVEQFTFYCLSLDRNKKIVPLTNSAS